MTEPTGIAVLRPAAEVACEFMIMFRDGGPDGEPSPGRCPGTDDPCPYAWQHLTAQQVLGNVSDPWMLGQCLRETWHEQLLAIPAEGTDAAWVAAAQWLAGLFDNRITHGQSVELLQMVAEIPVSAIPCAHCGATESVEWTTSGEVRFCARPPCTQASIDRVHDLLAGTMATEPTGERVPDEQRAA